MLTEKYKLILNDTINVSGVTLFRIKALKSFGEVKKGDLGGYIENEDNLSRLSNAWVSGMKRWEQQYIRGYNIL